MKILSLFTEAQEDTEQLELGFSEQQTYELVSLEQYDKLLVRDEIFRWVPLEEKDEHQRLTFNSVAEAKEFAKRIPPSERRGTGVEIVKSSNLLSVGFLWWSKIEQKAQAAEDEQQLEFGLFTFLNQEAPYVSYDQSEIAEYEIKYRTTEDDDFINEAKEEFRTENDLEEGEAVDEAEFKDFLQKKAENFVYGDADIYQWAWDQFVEDLDSLLNDFIKSDDNPDGIEALLIKSSRSGDTEEVSTNIGASKLIQEISDDRYDGKWIVWAKGDHITIYCGRYYDVTIKHYEEEND